MIFQGRLIVDSLGGLLGTSEGWRFCDFQHFRVGWYLERLTRDNQADEHHIELVLPSSSPNGTTCALQVSIARIEIRQHEPRKDSKGSINCYR
jgi:hypothetical protein